MFVCIQKLGSKTIHIHIEMVLLQFSPLQSFTKHVSQILKAGTYVNVLHFARKLANNN
jgi:hypothetical protein